MEFQRHRNKNIKLNLTPLIDLVFLLIIFFMLTTNFETKNFINVDFASSGKNAEENKKTKKRIINVVIADKNSFIINDESVDKGVISETLKNLIVQDDNYLITISSKRSGEVQDLVWVIEEIKSLGGENIIFTE